jgi:hypothetical protein
MKVKTILANDWLVNTGTKRKTFTKAQLKPHVKAAAIFAYCHGLIPASVTTWIIQGGGLRHE